MEETFPKLEENHSILSDPSKEDTSLQSLHEFFIKFKRHGAKHSEATIRSYIQTFKLFLKFKSNIRLMDLTEETMIAFFEFLNTRERQVGKRLISYTIKNSSVAIIRSNLNCFFVWLLERKHILINPFEKIPYPSITYTDRRAFSQKEFELICNAINTNIKWGSLLVKKRNIALIMVLALTGIRKEELLGLRLCDVDLESKFVVIRAETSKSKRTRIIPINSELSMYLEDYLLYRKDYTESSFWVSGTLDRRFTEHGAKHLINLLTKVTKINCHLHRFRHTFATNYYKQTHDIVGLKKLMGHQSFKMTISYLRSLPDEHIAEQIKKFTVAEFI